MRLEEYLVESKKDPLNEGAFQNILMKIKSKKDMFVKKLFRDSWMQFVKMVKDRDMEKEVLKILNKQFKINIRDLDRISKMPIKESIVMNEDWQHWWESVKEEGFPTLSFYPALTAWMELGKLLDVAGDVNWTKFSVYALFWLTLVTGKYLKGWEKWKKEHPEEYDKERLEREKKKSERTKKKLRRDREQSAFVKAIGTDVEDKIRKGKLRR